ncbi:MAG: signal peptide peptidase SppA [Alphaproteobacteria bacterium]|nr:signal peptide peptidase SppA [Alphaproteobacteria bacterium]
MPDRNFRQHRPLYPNTLPASVAKPKFRWKMLPILWLALKRIAMTIGFVVLVNIFIAITIIPALIPDEAATPKLPNEMVLFLTFEQGLLEIPEPATFSDPFAGAEMTVRSIVDALDHAREDDRVKGLVARMYAGNFELSQATEVRNAVKRFRDSGKFAYIYSSSYGEGGGGFGRYYLASAFEQIWMQPLGIVSITGVQAEIPFFRETLDKIGVRPQFFKRKDYKTAFESITEKTISKENRETMEQIINGIRDQLMAEIPADRGMSKADFQKLVDKGLLTAPEAEEAGLITHMDYADVLLDNIAEKVTGTRDPDMLELVEVERYAGVMKKKQQNLFGTKPKVALVYAVGAIMPTAEGGGFPADGVAAADEIAPAILEAADDSATEAIVLRIDSPGGSPAASESILRAIERAQGEGIPVIVSMGSTAASGGYWIAAYADKIYALPTTLTGSIGVVGGKFIFSELMDKAGVNFAEIGWGQNAGLWSSNSPFSRSEAERFNAMLDNVYSNFIARVAKGRGMTEEEVDNIAGGRVWTGANAIDVGLVDELGGLEDALDHAAIIIGEADRTDIEIVQYPKPKTAFEQIIELLDTQARIGETNIRMQEKFLGVAEPMLHQLSVMQNPQDYSTYEPLRVK